MTDNIIPNMPNRYSYFLPKKINLDHWFMHTPILLSNQLIEQKTLNYAINFLLQHHDSLRINVHFSNYELIQTLQPQEYFSDICKFYVYKKNKAYSFDEFLKDKIQENILNIKLPDKLINFLVFYNNENKTSVLVCLCHHLLADGYSFKIMIDDLIVVYNMILQNKPIALSKRSTSYREFCICSLKFFKQKIKEEIAYWKQKPWTEIKKLSFNTQNEQLANIEGNSTTSISIMEINSVEDFMKQFRGESSYGLIKLLLIAIAKAYKCHFNSDVLLISYTYNGRFSPHEDLRLDRTVGWFSEGCPLFIPTDGPLTELINFVESQIDRLYHHNSSYGYLKFIFNELQDDSFNPAQLSFNYIPPWLGKSAYSDFLMPTSEFCNPFTPKRDTQRVYLLNARAYFTQRNFMLSWNFSHALFDKSKIDIFANKCIEEFQNIINEIN